MGHGRVSGEPPAKQEGCLLGTRSPKPLVTMAEVETHNKPGDAWVVIEGRAYNISKWAACHPGGAHILHSVAGQDVSDPFRILHSEEVATTQLHRFHVADVIDFRESKITTDYKKLDDQIRRLGLYNTNLPRFYCNLAAQLGVFVFAVYWALTGVHTWHFLVSGLAMAFCWQQMAFMGHDLCHGSVSHDRQRDYLLSCLLGTTLTGISSAWWKRSHNTHHVLTNSVQHDPDIQHFPFLAITDLFFKSIYSTYHNHRMTFDAIARFFVTKQHLLYYPIMAFARYNLYAQSLALLLSRERFQYKRVELFTYVLFLTWLTALVYQMPTWTARLVWLLASHGAAGVLHIQITLSHFAMDVVDADANGAIHTEDFLRTQLATTMDIDTWYGFGWLHGGLQFQTEHHLFPRVPRANLPALKTILMQFCKERELPYKSMGFAAANWFVIKRLYRVAQQAHKGVVDTSMLTETIMLHG